MERHHATRDKHTAQACQDTHTFFTRNGFDGLTKDKCDSFGRLLYPQGQVTTVETQGFCSYTLSVSDDCLIQFRPDAFRLDFNICNAARDIFHNLVPTTTYLGAVQGIPSNAVEHASVQLHAYALEKMPGITLNEFRTMPRSVTDKESCRRHLVEDIADMFAMSLHRRHQGDQPKSVNLGQIGSSLRWRLDLLHTLHNEQFRGKVARLRGELEEIKRMPWCLTHGDLVPANIMVDPLTGHLTGLIDWAEGEWLPFGVGLYGLEEILGEDLRPGVFEYYPEHRKLRLLFWERFFAKGETIRPLPSSRGIRSTSELGILLWRGLAFEDGRIDRVAEPGRDDSELHKLEHFLASQDVSIIEKASQGAGVRVEPLIQQESKPRMFGSVTSKCVVFYRRWVGQTPGQRREIQR